MATTSVKLIRLRWPGRCTECNRELPKGSEAWHDPATRSVRCQTCPAAESSAETHPGASRSSVPPPAKPTETTIDPGVAGRGARRKFDQLGEDRVTRARERYGRLGVAAVRISPDPRHIAAWQRGAQGEERLAQRLTKLLAGTDVTLLHDRRIPMRVANIDHLAIGPGGVTVIDAKNYKGDVRVVSEGGLFSPSVTRLCIAGRDRTKLVDGVEKQIRVVQAALLDARGSQVPVIGALCFVNTDGLPLFGRRQQVRDVALVGPRGAARLANRAGELDAATVRHVTAALAERLPAN